MSRHASCKGLSPAVAAISINIPLTIRVQSRGPTTPTPHRYGDGLGSSPFARHYWGNH